MREKLQAFVKERLSEEKTKNMQDPIKKNKLPFFRGPQCQRETSKDKQKFSSSKSDCALLISHGCLSRVK